MKHGTILFTGKTNIDREIVVRYPEITDAVEMTEYINTLSNEKTFLIFQGEQNTVEEEKEYLDSLLKKIGQKEAVYLQVYHNKRLIGAAGIELGEKAEKHVGTFGISIAKEFRGEGIGKLLMNLVLAEAKKQLPRLKVCMLSVFGDNELAINMYRKMGFKQYGLLPNGILHKDIYVDHIYMYRDL